MTTSQLPEGVTLIRGKNPGPCIGIMAVIHGDEPAGLAGLSFLREYYSQHQLETGQLYLIMGNIKAQARNSRCVEDDINRIMLPDDDPTLCNINKKSADYLRSREIMPILAKLDFLLDLHNTTRPSPPFSVTLGGNSRQQSLAANLPVAYAASGFEKGITGTTIDWVNSHGGIGITVECGYQRDPEIGETAIACSKYFLGNIGISNFAPYTGKPAPKVEVITHELINEKSTFDYVRDFHNFDPVQPGELIARDAAKEYYAPDLKNLVIIFPVSVKTIREGSNTSAYFLGQIVS